MDGRKDGECQMPASAGVASDQSRGERAIKAD